MISETATVSIGVSHHSSPIKRTLSNFPAELILKIASFLPPESAACFSLCNRHTYFTLSQPYLTTLSANKITTHKFLMILSNDFPDLVACYHCQKFHHINSAEKCLPNNGGSGSACSAGSKCLHCRYRVALWDLGTENKVLPRRSRCLAVDLDLHMWKYVCPNFSSSVFRMAMKMHDDRRYSKCYELLALITGQTRRERKAYWGILYVEQGTETARIVNGHVLLRSQKILFVPSAKPPSHTHYWRVPGHVPGNNFVTICPHIYCQIFLQQDGLREAPDLKNSSDFFQILSSVDTSLCHAEGPITKCRHCFTEFRVDFKNHNEKETAIFITRWKYLGSSEDSPGYYIQGHGVGAKRRSHWEDARFKTGQICADFEGQPAHKFSIRRKSF